MKSIGIGVIGTGVLGTYHLNKCQNHPGVKIRGLYDIDTEKAAQISQRFACPLCVDVDDLIGQCDACIIATPAITHFSMAQRCLLQKKHVLIEKPLAESPRQGRAIATLADTHGCIVHVGHSEAFNPAFEFCLSRKLQPKFLEIHRLSEFSFRGTDVSVILDIMIHDIHLAVRLCGELPFLDRIAATGVSVLSDDIDIANVRLTFPSGCVANLTASRISAKRMRKVRIFQKDTYFSVDLNDARVEHYFLDRSHDSSRPDNPVSAIQRTESTFSGDALEKELDAFVRAIAEPRSSSTGVTVHEALDVLVITDAIISAITTRPADSSS